MENKKINVFFYLVVIFFLAVILILIKDFNESRVSEYNQYSNFMVRIVNQKNAKIRVLYHLLLIKERENAYLRNTLGETRNDLESLTRKLEQPAAQPTPPPAPAVVSAPAAPAQAATAPAAATK